MNPLRTGIVDALRRMGDEHGAANTLCSMGNVYSRNGDYDQAVPVQGPSEVKELAENFNSMVQQVQRSHIFAGVNQRGVEIVLRFRFAFCPFHCVSARNVGADDPCCAAERVAHDGVVCFFFKGPLPHHPGFQIRHDRATLERVRDAGVLVREQLLGLLLQRGDDLLQALGRVGDLEKAPLGDHRIGADDDQALGAVDVGERLGERKAVDVAGGGELVGAVLGRGRVSVGNQRAGSPGACSCLWPGS